MNELYSQWISLSRKLGSPRSNLIQTIWFDDGTTMRNAFDYCWHDWSITELRDIMLEAGFDITETYWEGTDKHGDGDGVFKKKKHAENEETWIAYLVAWKNKD